jgi:hypothetical protein
MSQSGRGSAGVLTQSGSTKASLPLDPVPDRTLRLSQPPSPRGGLTGAGSNGQPRFLPGSCRVPSPRRSSLLLTSRSDLLLLMNACAGPVATAGSAVEVLKSLPVAALSRQTLLRKARPPQPGFLHLRRPRRWRLGAAGRAYELPIKMPVSSTRMPPSTTCTSAEVNGVSMYFQRIHAMAASSRATTTPAMAVAVQKSLIR